MALPRFVMIGGFLGAGKTTTVARLARHYQSQGLRVGIVTNDQATDLVDTFNLRAQGFDVGEVPGSCFCCNFGALTSTVEQLGLNERPDVVIVEPVGSCTDLVATVLRPLVQIYEQPFDVAPYGVILKPSHGAKILRNASDAGFSPKAAYIFRKQIEEADFVILNRIDELPAAEIAELTALIEAQFPGRPVIAMSAKTGAGFDALCQMLDSGGPASTRSMDVDYDVYAEGEAELGWLNSSLTLSSSEPFVIDTLLLDLVGDIQRRLPDSAEVAHLKAIGLVDDVAAVANLVANALAAELSQPSGRRASSAQLVINARVAIDPVELRQIVLAAVEAICGAASIAIEPGQTQSFRPGRPVPTHRIMEST